MLPTRKHHRLAGYDYSSAGGYFITICADRHRTLFGSISEGRQSFTPLGMLAADLWRRTPDRFANCFGDAWVVMPNHLHAVVLLQNTGLQPGRPLASGLPSLVGGYKSAVSKEARRLGLASGNIWQSGYHDHIIRHEGALERIREYIMNNPAQWSLDRENPARDGEHEFYAWLESYTRKYSGKDGGDVGP